MKCVFVNQFHWDQNTPIQWWRGHYRCSFFAGPTTTLQFVPSKLEAMTICLMLAHHLRLWPNDIANDGERVHKKEVVPPANTRRWTNIFLCCANVTNGGPTLNTLWFNVSCLQGIQSLVTHSWQMSTEVVCTFWFVVDDALRSTIRWGLGRWGCNRTDCRPSLTTVSPTVKWSYLRYYNVSVTTL